MSALEYGTQPSAVAGKTFWNLFFAGVETCVPLTKKTLPNGIRMATVKTKKAGTHYVFLLWWHLLTNSSLFSRNIIRLYQIYSNAFVTSIF